MGGRKPKLAPWQVEEAANLLRAGWTTDRIAAHFRVAGSTVRRYLRGECRHHQRAA